MFRFFGLAIAIAVCFSSGAWAANQVSHRAEPSYRDRRQASLDEAKREAAIKIAMKWSSPEVLRKMGWDRYIEIPEAVNPVKVQARLEEFYDDKEIFTTSLQDDGVRPMSELGDLTRKCLLEHDPRAVDHLQRALLLPFKHGRIFSEFPILDFAGFARIISSITAGFVTAGAESDFRYELLKASHGGFPIQPQSNDMMLAIPIVVATAPAFYHALGGGPITEELRFIRKSFDIYSESLTSDPNLKIQAPRLFWDHYKMNFMTASHLAAFDILELRKVCSRVIERVFPKKETLEDRMRESSSTALLNR
jgi:hypothetical protein